MLVWSWELDTFLKNYYSQWQIDVNEEELMWKCIDYIWCVDISLIDTVNAHYWRLSSLCCLFHFCFCLLRLSVVGNLKGLWTLHEVNAAAVTTISDQEEISAPFYALSSLYFFPQDKRLQYLALSGLLASAPCSIPARQRQQEVVHFPFYPDLMFFKPVVRMKVGFVFLVKSMEEVQWLNIYKHWKKERRRKSEGQSTTC